MRAAFYSEQGPASDVLRVGQQPTPEPGPAQLMRIVETRRGQGQTADFGGQSVGLEGASRRLRTPPDGAADYSAQRRSRRY